MDKSEFAETSDDSQTPIDLATSVDNRQQFSSNGYRKVSLTSDCCNGYGQNYILVSLIIE